MTDGEQINRKKIKVIKFPQANVLAKGDSKLSKLYIKGVSIDTKPRKDGRWQARVTKNKTRKYLYAHSLSDLTEKVLLYLQAPPPPKQEPTAISFGDYLIKWLELYKKPKQSPGSYKNLFYTIRKHLIVPIGHIPINKLTASTLQETVNAIESSRQREIICNQVCACLKKAKITKVIKSNPSDALEKHNHTSDEGRALTLVEQTKLLTYLHDHPQQLLYSMYIYTSCRRNEALGIRVKNIDLKQRIIYIDLQIDKTGMQLVKLKTKRSKRYIPIPQPLWNLLTPAIEGRQPDDMLFPNLHPDTVSKKFKDICATLGIDNFTLHNLRHNYATRCEEAGISPKIIQEWMGHATMEMTKNRYTHITDDYRHAMISQADLAFDTTFDTTLTTDSTQSDSHTDTN